MSEELKAPEIIYLVPDGCDAISGEQLFSWCEDKITDEDIQYTRTEDKQAEPKGFIESVHEWRDSDNPEKLKERIKELEYTLGQERIVAEQNKIWLDSCEKAREELEQKYFELEQQLLTAQADGIMAAREKMFDAVKINSATTKPVHDCMMFLLHYANNLRNKASEGE